MQFEQQSVFATTDYSEAYHVGLLKDRGYVEADITCDSNGRISSAVIHRITAVGHDILEGEIIDERLKHKEEERDERKSLVKENYEAQKAFEKTLYLLSSGGIVLATTILTARHGAFVYTSCPYGVLSALGSWGVALALLLFLHLVSYKAHERQIEGIDSGQKEQSYYNNTWRIMVAHLYWIIAVVVTFGIVAFGYGVFRFFVNGH